MFKYALQDLVCVIVVLCFAPAVEAKCVKTMAWNDDYPYSFRANPDDRVPGGIYIKTVLTAFLPLNCTVSFIEMPFARAIVELEQGRIDIIGGALSIDSRHAFAIYSMVEFNSPNVLFLRTDDIARFPLQNLADIQTYKLRLGGQLGVAYSKEYTELRAQPEFSALLKLISDRKALWKMLQLHRIDGVIADLDTGLAELRQLGLQNVISPSHLMISTQPAYFIFSRKTTSQEFVKAFDAELKKLEEAGIIDAIQSNYY